MSTQPMMFKPRNAFYATLAQIEQRQDALSSRVEAIGAVLPDPKALESAISGLSSPLGDVGSSIAKSGADQAAAGNRAAAANEKAADALDRLAHSQHRMVRLIEQERHPESRAPTSLLFFGVDNDGNFVRETTIGEMLIAASAGATGLSLKPPAKTKPVTRHEFGERGAILAADYGLAMLDSQDFEDFFDQAPHVLRLLKETAARQYGAAN